jgi:hypothetical protein
MGGLGIQDPLLTNFPAFIASVSVGTASYLHLTNVIKAGHRWFTDQSFNRDVTLRPSLHDIHFALSQNGTMDLLKAFKDKHNIQEITVNDLFSQPRLQTFLASHMYSSINSAYRKSLVREDLDRMNSCCHEGAVLITALPCHDDFRLIGDHLFRERLQMRLGLSIPGIIPGKCLCKHGSNDIYGYHLLSVCNMGNQRIITHNAVRDSTREMCKAAGLTTRIEDMQTLKQNDIDTKSRVDITCDNFLPGVPMGIDNSIADPRQTGLTVKPIPGKAAKKREYSKIKKYRTDLARQGTRFEPFVLESYGRWGYRTRVIFKQLISKIMDNSKLHAGALDQSVVTHYWRCKVTLAMHRQACLGMHCRIHALQNHHKIRSDLRQVVLSKKVFQSNPFQDNVTILDDYNRLESYASTFSITSSHVDTTLSATVSEQPWTQQEESTKSSNFTNNVLLPLPLGAVNIATNSSVASSSIQHHHHNNTNYIKIHVYTDGSCKNNKRGMQSCHPAGWGIVVLQESYCLTNDTGENNNTTSLLAELYGPVVTDINSEFFSWEQLSKRIILASLLLLKRAYYD